MRNLKRVLSLALALVMVLGMMVITTSAAKFTDAEEITKTEAVDVMSAIGVITGDNGNFYPNRVLTREEGAAFICYMLMGKEKADKLVGSGNFADVKADRWSAGEIDYCANLGIILGYTDADGKQVFNPKGELTAVAFGRMLLGALGYDATVEGYTGSNWASAIASDMIDVGLEVKDVDMGAQLTREQAAQMAFQALTKTLVKYSTKGTSITIDGVQINSGASEAAPVTYAEAGGYDYTAGTNTAAQGDTVQFCEKYFKNLSKDASDNDDYGRPGHSWTVDDNNPATVNVKVFAAEAPIAVYTAATKAEDIAKALEKNLEGSEISAATIALATGNGKVVEVYGTDRKIVDDIVVIAEKLGKITKVTPAKDDAKRSVTVAGMSFVTEDFAKDDIVLYTTNEAGNKIVTMAAPKTFVGKVESYNGTLKTVTIGGQTYKYGYDFTPTAEFTKDYTFTQYSDGSIADQVEVKATAAVSKNYVYVVSTQYVKGGATNLVESTENAAKAQVIFADGTAGVIDLNIYKDATQVGKPDVVKMPASNGSVTKTNLNTISVAAIENWFAYTAEADGTYTLSAIDAKYAKVLNADATLTKDTMASLGGKYTTKDTAITYVDTTAPNAIVTNMTGFVAVSLDVEKTISEVTYSNLVLVTYAGPTATTVSAVYAVKQAPISAPDTTYAYAVKQGNSVADGTEWTFAIEGKQETYVIAAGQSVSVGSIYTLTKGEKNYTVTNKDGDLTGTALVTVVDGDQVATSAGSVLTLGPKVNVYNVDDTAEVVGEVKALEVGDVIDYIVANGKVTNIWVYGVDATVEAKTTTLAATLATVPAGTTIALADGTYSAITLNGSQAANLTIVGNGADTVVAGLTSNVAVNGLTLKNIKFTAGVNLNAAVTTVTVSGCQFVGSGEDDNAIAICISANSGKVIIADNVIDGFDYPMQLNPAAATEITGNIIKNTHDRAIRFLQVAANVTVTINDNAMIDACDGDNEVFKVGYTGYNAVASGAKITFDGNTYDGAAWDPADITTASVDAIAYTIAQG